MRTLDTEPYRSSSIPLPTRPLSSRAYTSSTWRDLEEKNELIKSDTSNDLEDNNNTPLLEPNMENSVYNRMASLRAISTTPTFSSNHRSISKNNNKKAFHLRLPTSTVGTREIQE